MFIQRRAIILVAFVAVLVSCNNLGKKKSDVIPDKTKTSLDHKKNDPSFMYGIPVDSFDLIPGYIKPNGFISDILLRHGVSMQEIDRAIKSSASVFDVRTIRSGNKYILFCDRDSIARARYLVYEHDASNCFVFSFNDSINITTYKKEIKREVKYASATIETSLWDAMLSGGLPPSLVLDLSDVFAWTVDFFGLQKGDNFKVIYEELFIDDKSLGSARIYGAQFNSGGTSITAIPFFQDSTESYFDSDGKSLKKAFLKAPLQFSRITSRFSASRMHPILRIRRPHFGVDYAAPIGTPVRSIGDGRVTQAGTGGGSGRIVRIQHNSVYATSYMHLSGFAKGITAGAHVKQGDIIGYVGSSGLSTGPHLDFRFYRNGSPVDPFKVDAPPVEPVSEQNKQRFEINKSVVLGLLGTIK